MIGTGRHLHRLGDDRLATGPITLVVEQHHIVQIGEDRIDRVLGLPAPGEFIGAVADRVQQLADQRVFATIAIDQQHADGFFTVRTGVHASSASMFLMLLTAGKPRHETWSRQFAEAYL
jgi:hypothetical protein